MLSVALLTWISLACTDPSIEAVSAAEEKQVLDEMLDELGRLGKIAFPNERDRHRFAQLVDEGNKLFPHEPSMLYWVGDFLERRADPENAAEAWKQSLDSKSRLPGVDDRTAWARSATRLGWQALGSNNVAEASKRGAQAREWAAHDPGGYQLAVHCSFRDGNIEQTLQLLRDATHAQADNERITGLYLDYLAQVGEWSALREELERRQVEKAPTPESAHFQASLAELDGNSIDAFAWHFLAMNNGPVDRQTTRRSTDEIHRLTQRLNQGSGLLADLVLAYTTCDRLASAPKAVELVRERTSAQRLSDPIGLVADQLLATALLWSEQPSESAEVWDRIIERAPWYAPGFCGKAEALEVLSRHEEADALLAKARGASPRCRRLRMVDRLGGQFALDGAGLLVRDVRPGSPLAQLGIAKGDVVTDLDGEHLEDLPPVERFRTVRLWQGGDIAWKVQGDETKTGEVDLIIEAP